MPDSAPSLATTPDAQPLRQGDLEYRAQDFGLMPLYVQDAIKELASDFGIIDVTALWQDGIEAEPRAKHLHRMVKHGSKRGAYWLVELISLDNKLIRITIPQQLPQGIDIRTWRARGR